MSKSSQLRILITNSALVGEGGTEMFCWDMAHALRERGHHPMVFSPRIGPFARRLRRQGIEVAERLDQLTIEPDVIQAQHRAGGIPALLRFPRVPALLVCHGVVPWQEQPFDFPSLRRVVAVDDAVAAHLRAQDIGRKEMAVIRTAVDLSKFRLRPRIAPRPRRALVFGGAGFDADVWLKIRSTCESIGVERLDEVGNNVGGLFSRPEQVLSRYDLVFGKGRAAHEAAATGAAVVVGDRNRMAGLLTLERYPTWRALNFGFRTFTHEVTVDGLKSELEQYDHRAIRRVAERLRTEANLSVAVDLWESLHHAVAAEKSWVEAIPEPELATAVKRLAMTPQWEGGQPLPGLSAWEDWKRKLVTRAWRRWRLYRQSGR